MTITGFGNTAMIISASRLAVIRTSSYSLTRLVSTSGGDMKGSEMSCWLMACQCWDINGQLVVSGTLTSLLICQFGSSHSFAYWK
jgi:hypothetical protein